MYLQSEVLKHINSSHTTSASISAVNMYLDHAPENTDYPIITYNIITNIPTLAMGSTGNDYADFVVQFNVYGNDQQFSDCMDILNNIETVYHRKTGITLNNDVTLICSRIKGGNLSYFNQAEKIWKISEDFSFLVGK